MISELQKIFDRNFIICYLLPVAIFSGISLLSLNLFEIPLPTKFLLVNTKADSFLGVTVIGIVLWLSAVFLMAVNREWIRSLEGYGKWHPLRFLKRFKINKFNELTKIAQNLETQKAQYNNDPAFIPQKIKDEENYVRKELSLKFPDSERWILPTTFGNIIRSFEVYPRVMYGLDGIPGWNRLVALIPEQFTKTIETTESNVYFWANCILISLLLIIEIVMCSIIGKAEWYLPFILIAIFLIISFICYLRANSAAIQWGEMVKAAFDLYIGDLFEKLSFDSAIEPDSKKIWNNFSRATIFRNPEKMPKRKYYK